MQKFNRNYFLQVGTQGGGTITIQPPFTIEFDITRNTLTSANVCSIRIYNLNKNHRSQIRFNPIDQGDFRPVFLQAGYGSNLATIFAGNITQAWSIREGVNFITTIESFDGGYAFNNGDINMNFPAGTAMTTVVGGIAGALPNLQPGYIGSFPGSLARGSSYVGNGINILRDLTGGGIFIDNSTINCLGDNECLPANGISVIDDSTGLIGTPLLEQTILHFDTIFEPKLVVGQQVQFNSTTESVYNGIYKVTALKHRGMISGAVCGDAITTIEVFAGTAALSTVSAKIP
jgi:hypothetical protein